MTTLQRMACVLGLMAAVALAAGAQAPSASPLGATPAKREPISDNSFLIEEAYNQDPGVVQHISVFQRPRSGDGWGYTFTQEWPLGGQRHQISYTVPYSSLGARTTGFGDLLVHYRIQALADDKAGTFIAPRLSLVLPTGDYKKGLGTGVVGLQALVPVSHELTDEIMSHSNVGATFLPSAKDPLGKTGTSTTFLLGQSFIWLAQPRLNVMLETLWTSTTRKVGTIGSTAITTYISPGVRWGYDFASGLQVVPGIAFPIGVGASRGDDQVVVYLSFEHPFTARR